MKMQIPNLMAFLVLTLVILSAAISYSQGVSVANNTNIISTRTNTTYRGPVSKLSSSTAWILDIGAVVVLIIAIVLFLLRKRI